MSTARFALLLMAISWLPITTSAVQNDAQTTVDQPVDNEADSAEAGVENTGNDPSEHLADTETAVSTTVTEPVEASWAATVDKAFGEWVVGPFANVLFFDFGTETWLGTKIPFVVVWLLLGAVFLTLKMGFINIRAFKHAIDLTRGKYDKEDDTGEVSHFQALSAALSATVGLGNIAGVAIAIGTGGPGACLWIIAIGILGMSAKFAECTLGQIYRVKDEDGHVLGGPMRYLQTGLAEIGWAPLGKILAILFMLLCIGASFGGGNAFQIGQSLEAVRGDIPSWKTTRSSTASGWRS